ncbi:hypothetical protein QAD02_008778 [Eretmocerus hayati]|uniref:Uncharacterized protein n=1 Tax=Eretmocerus hayati TaxID=131215 RepID=A0ACC2N7S2_9HYME|nr:hypothetical protein QAD02_008778 [Eretmocerus hayati]
MMLFERRSTFFKFDISTGLYGFNEGELIKILNEKFETIAPTTLLFEDICPKENLKKISDLIHEFYLARKPIDLKTSAEVTDMYTDAWFYIAADEAVRKTFGTSVIASLLLLFYLQRKFIVYNPTPEVTSDLPIKWKPVRTPDLEYLNIWRKIKEIVQSNSRAYENEDHRTKHEL